MKRIISIVLAILTVACLAVPVAAATESGHGKRCTNCAETGDLDQNGVFELEDAIAIRDDHRELCMGDAEVNVYMVQHGITGDYGQFINELIYFE